LQGGTARLVFLVVVVILARLPARVGAVERAQARAQLENSLAEAGDRRHRAALQVEAREAAQAGERREVVQRGDLVVAQHQHLKAGGAGCEAAAEQGDLIISQQERLQGGQRGEAGGASE
jgi:hypothetical protein